MDVSMQDKCRLETTKIIILVKIQLRQIVGSYIRFALHSQSYFKMDRIFQFLTCYCLSFRVHRQEAFLGSKLMKIFHNNSV